MADTFKSDIIMITVNAFIMLLNFLEITLILRRWRKIKPYEQLLLNIAIADFLVGGGWAGVYGYQIHNPKWAEEESSWLIIGFSMFSVVSSGMSICLISIDQIIAIIYPLRYEV